jgi:hypothetical protein
VNAIIDKHGLTQFYSLITLGCNERIELPDPIGYHVHCRSGCIWITHAQLKEVRRLDTGRTTLIQHGGKIILRSQDPAEIEIVEDASARLGMGHTPSSGVTYARVSALGYHPLPSQPACARTA